MSEPSNDVIEALLIDPFKACLVSVNVSGRSIDQRWHMLLDCDCVDAVQVSFLKYGPHAIWIDDEGLLREPAPYPQFRVLGVNGDAPLTGYGILTRMTEGGRGDVASVHITAPELAPLIQFEEWSRRLKPEDYIPQLLRLYLPWP
jgi:hypothetical protein